jgi:hypothetical protein
MFNNHEKTRKTLKKRDKDKDSKQDFRGFRAFRGYPYLPFPLGRFLFIIRVNFAGERRPYGQKREGRD